MILDDSDEEAPSAPDATPFVDKPEFEDESSENGSLYPDIVQTLDLALGSAVLHVAVPPMTPCAAEDAAPEILQQKMVFAVSCATKDISVITLPLTPPSQASKERPELRSTLLAGDAGKGVWGETVTALAGQERPSDGVAITLVKASTLEQISTTTRSRSNSNLAVHIVVAAHSRDASGTLRLWDITISPKGVSGQGTTKPFQTEYLPSPLTGIAFNPTRNTQLLAVASPHAVRVFDYSLPSVTLVPDDLSNSAFPPQGSWLLSLYPPLARGSLNATARKPVVAAAWAAHGRAVLALLADGQWGIWDVEGTGPSASGSGDGLFGKSGAGVRGAALTAFSVTGQLEGTSPLRNPGSRKTDGELVPMTPHTRRESLATSFAGGPERLATIRGGLEVVQLPALRGGASDESAVLWLGGGDHVVAIIPGIARFWDARMRRGAGGGVNLFSGAQPSRMIRLTELHAGLMGERCCGVNAVARFPRRHGDDDSLVEGLPVEVLVQGESRLVVVRESDDVAAPLTSRLFGTRKRKLGPVAAAEPASAIIVHARRDKPAPAVSFDLSLAKRGTLMEPRARAGDGRSSAAAGASFDSSVYAGTQTTVAFSDVPRGDEHLRDEGVTLTQSMMFAPRTPERGLGFVHDLEDAANASDDEDAAEDRNVEEEMLDIMEIDRALEEMQGDREAGRKHVFFEDG